MNGLLSLVSPRLSLSSRSFIVWCKSVFRRPRSSSTSPRVTKSGVLSMTHKFRVNIRSSPTRSCLSVAGCRRAETRSKPFAGQSRVLELQSETRRRCPRSRRKGRIGLLRARERNGRIGKFERYRCLERRGSYRET